MASTQESATNGTYSYHDTDVDESTATTQESATDSTYLYHDTDVDELNDTPNATLPSGPVQQNPTMPQLKATSLNTYTLPPTPPLHTLTPEMREWLLRNPDWRQKEKLILGEWKNRDGETELFVYYNGAPSTIWIRMEG
jgi:hypothetical protein